MAIPAAQLAILTAGQTQINNAKAALSALITGGDAMMVLASSPVSPVMISYTQKHREKARELLALLGQFHADVAKDIIAQYGASDPDVITVMGGGGR